MGEGEETGEALTELASNPTVCAWTARERSTDTTLAFTGVLLPEERGEEGLEPHTSIPVDTLRGVVE